LIEVVVFPTPPFWFATAIILADRFISSLQGKILISTS